MEPLKGAEFCRSGSICQLHVTVAQQDAGADLKAVMYEVLADQNMWAVCGRSSGQSQSAQFSHSQLRPVTAAWSTDGWTGSVQCPVSVDAEWNFDVSIQWENDREKSEVH